MADEKTTVVETGGGGAGTVVAVVIGVIALLVILYLVFGSGMLNGTKQIDANVKVEQSK
jgi:hypothetical protein